MLTLGMSAKWHKADLPNQASREILKFAKCRLCRIPREFRAVFGALDSL
jgi:hypothetical protein